MVYVRNVDPSIAEMLLLLDESLPDDVEGICGESLEFHIQVSHSLFVRYL
jgi:hypothetical protein